MRRASRVQLRLVPRDAAELRHRHEAKTASLESGHCALERSHRLRAVTSSVVEEHDAALGAARCDPAHDRVDPRTPPVLAVEIRERDHVSPASQMLVGPLLGIVDGGRHRRVRRPDEPGTDSDGAGDRALRQRDLQRPLPVGDGREIRVRERVIPELEALTVQRADDVRVARHLAADDEERRRDSEAPERGRDPRRPARVGAVVEAERDLVAGGATVRDEPPAVPDQDGAGRGQRARECREAELRCARSSSSRGPGPRAGPREPAGERRGEPSGRRVARRYLSLPPPLPFPLPGGGGGGGVE